MIAKEDIFELINILRDMYGNAPIAYINRILKIIEKDSGKVWDNQLFKDCLNKNINLENIWERILNSVNIPNSESV